MPFPPLAREIYRDIGIGALIIKAAVVDGEEFVEKISRFIGIKKWIERRLGERRHTMINPITIVTDINLAVTAITKVQAALPQIAKTVADIKQAVADKSDTTKLDADLANLMSDVMTDLNDIANLFPAAPVTTPAPVAPAA